MRRVETSDFDATNIQYIEFWMMDPFVYDSLNSGDLYFNLGDVSEDILRDGMKSYENGLPTSEEVIECGHHHLGPRSDPPVTGGCLR